MMMRCRACFDDATLPPYADMMRLIRCLMIDAFDAYAATLLPLPRCCYLMRMRRHAAMPC